MPTSQQSRLLSFVPKIFRSNNHRMTKIDLSARNAIPKTQKNPKFAQLPEEILFLIMENLWKEAKVNVIKTCRSLRSLLEYTLYTHLSPIDPWDDTNKYKTGLLHRKLVGREDLIPCIRSYSGLIMPWPTHPSSKRNVVDRLWNREDTPITWMEAFKNSVFVFSRACNITILEFTDRSNDWTLDPYFEPIRTAVSKMSLFRLHLRYCHQPVQVLRPQLVLEHLEIHCGRFYEATLDEIYLPKLMSLKGPLREASEIVPGSPIEELDLTSGYSNWDDELFKSLTLSTKPITRFSVRLHHPWLAEKTRGTLQLISQNLPDIEHLTIIVAGCISDQILLNEIPSPQYLRNVNFRVANLATFPVQDDFPTQDRIDTAQNGGPTHQAHAFGDWEDLTTRLKTMCLFLVHVEHTPLTEGIPCCPSTA